MNKFYSLIFFSLFFSISLTSDKKIYFLKKIEKSRSRTPEKYKKNNIFNDEKETEKKITKGISSEEDEFRKKFVPGKLNVKGQFIDPNGRSFLQYINSPKSTKMKEEDKKRLILAPKKKKDLKNFNF